MAIGGQSVECVSAIIHIIRNAEKELNYREGDFFLCFLNIIYVAGSVVLYVYIQLTA